MAALLLLLGCLAAPAWATGNGTRDYSRFLRLYDGLLIHHTAPSFYKDIHYQGVDYDSWKTDEDYPKARKILLATDPAQFISGAEKKAFWINAYNFLTIDLIISQNEKHSIRNLGTIFQTPWKKYEWDIGGKAYTLDQIEQDILRKLGDERIHFALNCASLSCPDLWEKAYRAEILEEQLDSQTQAILYNDIKGVLITGGGANLRISKIFKWYAKDFNRGDVKGWLKHRRFTEIMENPGVSYFPYNWGLTVMRKRTDMKERYVH